MRASKNPAVNWVIVIVTVVIGSICLCVLLGWDTIANLFR